MRLLPKNHPAQNALQRVSLLSLGLSPAFIPTRLSKTDFAQHQDRFQRQQPRALSHQDHSSKSVGLFSGALATPLTVAFAGNAGKASATGTDDKLVAAEFPKTVTFPKGSKLPKVRYNLYEGDISPKALDYFLTQDVLGCDTETTGLNPNKDHLQLVQLCTRDNTAALVQIRPGQVPGNLKRLLEAPHVTKVFHNASFDLAFLEKQADTKGSNIYCTKLASYELRGKTPAHEQGFHTLKRLLKDILSLDLDKSFMESDNLPDWSGKLTPRHIQYAISDVTQLAPLFDHFQAKRQENRPVFYLKEVPFKDKDQIRNLGGRWDPEKKLWYVPWALKDAKVFDGYQRFLDIPEKAQKIAQDLGAVWSVSHHQWCAPQYANEELTRRWLAKATPPQVIHPYVYTEPVEAKSALSPVADSKPGADKSIVYLKVPFAEKEAAKSLGARWDAAQKLWFIPWSQKNKAGVEQWPKYLTVPSQDAVRASQLGAKYDPQKNRWYAPIAHAKALEAEWLSEVPNPQLAAENSSNPKRKQPAGEVEQVVDVEQESTAPPKKRQSTRLAKQRHETN